MTATFDVCVPVSGACQSISGAVSVFNTCHPGRIAADHPTSLHPLCVLLANRQIILWQPPAPLRFIQAGGSESERILSEKIYLR
jgi:hypothetical protein